MPKIPKNLSDKDMLQNWVEEETLESQFEKAEQAAKAREKERGPEPPAELLRAGFTPELTEKLGKALTELKLQLAQQGVTKYSYKIKKDGETITISPKYKA